MRIIEDFALDFLDGQVVKYMLRSGNKPGEPAGRDYEKALWYLQRKIGSLKQNPPDSSADPQLGKRDADREPGERSMICTESLDSSEHVFEVQLSKDEFASVLRFDSLDTMQEHLRLFGLKPTQIWLWFPRAPGSRVPEPPTGTSTSTLGVID